MAPLRALLGALTLLSAALAGCAGDPSPPEVFDDGLAATPDTGIIRGVIVDEAIAPVDEAAVSLSGAGVAKQATTGKDGLFGFDGLPAGTYFLKVQRVGFLASQRSVDVVAGDDEPDIVRIALQRDAAYNPYFESYVFEGFIECSGTFVVVVFAACSAPNVASQIVALVTCEENPPLPPSPACVDNGNITNDAFAVRYNLTTPPDWSQSELVWESTQALGDRFSLRYSWDCNDTLLCDHGIDGPSPLVLTADRKVLADIGVGNGTDLLVRVFNSGLQETMGSVGFTLEQSFTIYTTVFYGYLPPEGWTFTGTGGVPAPPR